MRDAGPTRGALDSGQPSDAPGRLPVGPGREGRKQALDRLDSWAQAIAQRRTTALLQSRLERKGGRGSGSRRPSSPVRETRGVSPPVLSCSLIVTHPATTPCSHCTFQPSAGRSAKFVPYGPLPGGHPPRMASRDPRLGRHQHSPDGGRPSFWRMTGNLSKDVIRGSLRYHRGQRNLPFPRISHRRDDPVDGFL